MIRRPRSVAQPGIQKLCPSPQPSRSARITNSHLLSTPLAPSDSRLRPGLPLSWHPLFRSAVLPTIPRRGELVRSKDGSGGRQRRSVHSLTARAPSRILPAQRLLPSVLRGAPRIGSSNHPIKRTRPRVSICPHVQTWLPAATGSSRSFSFIPPLCRGDETRWDARPLTCCSPGPARQPAAGMVRRVSAYSRAAEDDPAPQGQG